MAKPTEKEKDAKKAMERAAKDGDPHAIRALLAQDANLARESFSGGLTALILAAFGGHLDCVKELLPHSDAKQQSADGLSALIAAVGHPECMKELLPLSNPDARWRGLGTAAMVAARDGETESLKLLLAHCHVIAKANTDQTPLALAAMEGHLDCVEALLPVSRVDDARHGESALTFAVKMGHRDCAKILAQASGEEAKILALNKLVSAKGGPWDVIRDILPFMNPKGASAAGQTALMSAAKAGRLECVLGLLPLSDAAAADNKGKTAFDWALQIELWPCVEALAPKMPIEAARAAVQAAAAKGVELCGCQALVEQEELRQAVAGAERARVEACAPLGDESGERGLPGAGEPKTPRAKTSRL